MERSARFPRPTAFLTRVPVLRVKSRRRVYSKVRTSAPEKEAPGKREESRPEGKRKTRKLKKKEEKKIPRKPSEKIIDSLSTSKFQLGQKWSGDEEEEEEEE